MRDIKIVIECYKLNIYVKFDSLLQNLTVHFTSLSHSHNQQCN